MGEHGLFGPVCGIAFDGTGYGADGRVWGGEVLLANQQAFERFANFAYVPMPGGAAAVQAPAAHGLRRAVRRSTCWSIPAPLMRCWPWAIRRKCATR